MNKKIVVYTAIFGDYDVLLDPKHKSESCDYVCFTDNQKLGTKIWTPARLPNEQLPPALLNRKVKILPHLYFPDYEYSVYVDGNIEIIGHMEELVDKYLKEHYMACAKHQERDCIYQETEVCIELELDNSQYIREQMARYKRVGYPKYYGLTDNSILLRRHNEPLIKQVMEDWWIEIERGSKRDQLSFGFVAWKHGLKYALMEENARISNEYFRIHPHKIRGISNSLWKIWLHVRVNRDKSVIHALSFHAVKTLGHFVIVVWRKLLRSCEEEIKQE